MINGGLLTRVGNLHFFLCYTASRFYMSFSRKTMTCEILKQSLIGVGEWDKVTILDGNYYDNFMAIINYVKEVENGKN